MSPQRSHKLRIVMMFVAVLAIALMPADVLAKAGGGGGGKGSGIVGAILLPFILIYHAILSHFVTKKYRESKNLLAKLAQKDKIWNLEDIKYRVEITYFKVQEAWRVRDQSIAKEYMSDRLFDKHKVQTDQMIRQGRINVLEKVSLIKSAIVQVADYHDDSKDCLWVYIKGSMVDYTIDEKTKEIVEGKQNDVSKFTELWKFIRNPERGWVLDEIEQEARISEIADFHSFSEDLAIAQGSNVEDEIGKMASGAEWLLTKKDQDLPEIKSPYLALLVGLLFPWIAAFIVFWQFYSER